MAIIRFNQCYLTLSSHAFITRTTGPDTIVDWLKFADFAKPCQNAPSSKDYEVLNLKLRDYEAEEQLVYLKKKINQENFSTKHPDTNPSINNWHI